jgi:hypothetical protein
MRIKTKPYVDNFFHHIIFSSNNYKASITALQKEVEKLEKEMKAVVIEVQTLKDEGIGPAVELRELQDEIRELTSRKLIDEGRIGQLNQELEALKLAQKHADEIFVGMKVFGMHALALYGICDVFMSNFFSKGSKRWDTRMPCCRRRWKSCRRRRMIGKGRTRCRMRS